MLLAKETNPVQDLPGSGAGGLEPLAKLCILPLEPLDALGRDLGTSTRPLNRLHPGFGLQRAPAEARELVAEVADELLKLVKAFHFRTIAVGFQVCSRVR